MAPPLRWDHAGAGTGSRVWVDGELYEVTGEPAQFLAALASGDLGEIIPGMLASDAQRLSWLGKLYDAGHPFDLGDARAVIRAVITEIAGIPAETAISLARWLTDDWLLLDGYHLRYGTDLLALAPRRVFAVLYAFMAEHRYETRDDADRELFPPTLAPPTAADQAQDAANFEAALAMAGALPGTG